MMDPLQIVHVESMKRCQAKSHVGVGVLYSSEHDSRNKATLSAESQPPHVFVCLSVGCAEYREQNGRVSARHREAHAMETPVDPLPLSPGVRRYAIAAMTAPSLLPLLAR